MPSLDIARIRRLTKGLAITVLWRWRGVKIPDRIVCSGFAPEMGSSGTVILGSRISFRGMRRRSRLGSAPGALLKIGDRCFINSGTTIEASVSIIIGANCLIGDDVQIQDSNYHEVDEGAGVIRSGIQIGRNVWIGNRAMILPGVVVGDHSVIAAGAIVTKSFPDRSLIAGAPASLKRQITASDEFRPT